MTGISFDGTQLQALIQESLPKLLSEALANKYDSPLKKAIDAELATREGTIKTLIRELFTKILNDPAFKDKLAQEVIATIIQRGLKG